MNVKIRLFLSFLFFLFVSPAEAQDSLTIRNIYDFALKQGKCYSWLDFLSNRIGGRLSGSPEAAQAVNYVRMEMVKLNPDEVQLQEVMF